MISTYIHQGSSNMMFQVYMRSPLGLCFAHADMFFPSQDGRQWSELVFSRTLVSTLGLWSCCSEGSLSDHGWLGPMDHL